MKRIGKICLSALLFLALFPLPAQYAITPINQSIGLPLLPQRPPWQRQQIEQTLRQNGLMFQGDNSRRSAFLQGRKIFEIPAQELLLISDADDMVVQMDVIYSNKGDSANARNMKRDIRKSGRSLKATLTRLLRCNPVKDEFGPEGLQKDVLVWKCGDIRFIVETSREEYTILHICRQKKPDQKPKRKELLIHKADYSANIRENQAGDLYVENIPMVNQGSKGYCVPATMERVLRYYGITQITMHQLADAAGTGRGGGTSVNAMNHAIGKLRYNFGLDIRSCGEVRMDTLKKYINQGIPVIWAMYVNPSFMQLMQNSRALRPNAKSPEQWLKSIRKYKLSRGGEAHVCLIVGYNVRTEEIAISNSWGDAERIPAWIPLKFALRVSQKETLVLVPKK